MTKNVLLVPSVIKTNGTGHLKRMITLAQEFKGEPEVSAALFLETGDGCFSDLHRSFPSLAGIDVLDDPGKLGSFDLIILDKRKTDVYEWLDWERRGPVVLLDEGGAARTRASLVIDALPNLEKHKPNIKDPSLLYLGAPENRKSGGGRLRYLISFGGEDPAELTAPVVRTLLHDAGVGGDRIGVVLGPLMSPLSFESGVTLYDRPDSLNGIYRDYDVLIGSYGLTPLEALNKGLSVILVNPSVYHEKLAKSIGLPTAGVGSRGVKRLPHMLGKTTDHEKILVKTAGEGRTLGKFILSLGMGNVAACPFCGNTGNPVVKRFGLRSYYTCIKCRNDYLVTWREDREDYDREYFYGRYKEQYGKTYLEDFENIKEMGFSRIGEIAKRVPPNGAGGLLTDLGCAFGPFLCAASEAGYTCRGVEINCEAASWVRENLNIPVIAGSLFDSSVIDELSRSKSRIITLWYVIEHIADQRLFFDMLKSWLVPGGVLAFGTPSGRGISFIRSKDRFYQSSPADHYVIFTPRGTRRFLRSQGFTDVKVKSVGHHPERFGKWVGKKGSISYNTAMIISRVFRLGDSIEVYARYDGNKE